MKRRKKVVRSIMMLCLILAGLLTSEGAYASSDSGTDGEIKWVISGDTLTLSAAKSTKGRMKDYSNEKRPEWEKSGMMETINNIIITDGITKLGHLAFGRMDVQRNIDRMEIAGTVETIPSAFYYSHDTIDTVVIKEGVTEIESMAFPLQVYTVIFLISKSEVLNID